MGTCYSKSGHELDASYTDNRPKERKGSKNGHVKSKKGPKLVVNDIDYIQKDLSDTVYTEDSHVIQTLDVDNKSQQTSLDQLTKDGSKSIENQTGLQINTQNELFVLTGSDKTGLHNEDNNVTNLNTNLQNVIAEPMKQINATDVGSCESAQDGMVVTSDSGIGIEQCDAANANVTCKYSKCCDSNVKTENTASPYSSSHDDENVHSFACSSNPKLNDSRDNVFHSEHSNVINCNHEGEKRRSLASIDQLSESLRSTDSAPDLDKIKLALQHSSVSTPTEHRSFTESGDTSYELGSVQQPEVTTMVMNGREVVVIDSELFSQIIDEIQLLKMKLSQLTDVIQDAEDSEIPHILSSSA